MVKIRTEGLRASSGLRVKEKPSKEDFQSSKLMQ